MNHPYPTPEEIWQDYTANESPRDFVARQGGDSAAACVDRFLATLPHTFGIVRNENWRKSFAQPHQLRYQEVHYGLVAFLESCRDDWTLTPFEQPPPVVHHHHIEEISEPDSVSDDLAQEIGQEYASEVEYVPEPEVSLELDVPEHEEHEQQ
jgi:hypothetical protein